MLNDCVAGCNAGMLMLSGMALVFVRESDIRIPKPVVQFTAALHELTLNIPSLARQRCLPSWGPRRTPWFFFVVISQLFDAVDYSNYAFWISETIIQ